MEEYVFPLFPSMTAIVKATQTRHIKRAACNEADSLLKFLTAGF